MGCKDGAVLRALASHQCQLPGFDSQPDPAAYMGYGYWFSILLCSERFSPGTPVSPLLKTQHLT